MGVIAVSIMRTANGRFAASMALLNKTGCRFLGAPEMDLCCCGEARNCATGTVLGEFLRTNEEATVKF